MTSENKTRRVDYYGKIMIPKNLRRELGIESGDELYVYSDSFGVYFSKRGDLADGYGGCRRYCEQKGVELQ